MKRQSGVDQGSLLVGSADENLHAGQQNAFATTMESALFGNVSSVRFCMDLDKRAEQTQESVTSISGFSQAAAWAAEPEWEGEASEQMAETAAGSWEPEE